MLLGATGVSSMLSGGVSTAHADAIIRTVYKSMLGREPDAGAVAHRALVMAGGEAALRAAVTNWPEYKARTGLTPAAAKPVLPVAALPSGVSPVLSAGPILASASPKPVAATSATGATVVSVKPTLFVPPATVAKPLAVGPQAQILTTVAVSPFSATGAPAGYELVTVENGVATFDTPRDVAYGANGKFVYRTGMKGRVVFDNATFGDPIVGVVKAGYAKLAPPITVAAPVKPVNPVTLGAKLPAIVPPQPLAPPKPTLTAKVESPQEATLPEWAPLAGLLALLLL